MERVVGITGLVVIAVLVLGGVVFARCGGHQAVAFGDAVRPEARSGGASDPCIPPHPFDLPTRGPRPC